MWSISWISWCSGIYTADLMLPFCGHFLQFPQKWQKKVRCFGNWKVWILERQLERGFHLKCHWCRECCVVIALHFSFQRAEYRTWNWKRLPKNCWWEKLSIWNAEQKPSSTGALSSYGRVLTGEWVDANSEFGSHAVSPYPKENLSQGLSKP